MRVCHASDLHGKWEQLPEADLYVLTGDMLPNFPTMVVELDKFDRSSTRVWYPNMELLGEPEHHPFSATDMALYQGYYVRSRSISADREVDCQTRWCKRQDFRSYFGNRDAPVVLVAGNHDFIHIGDFIGGDVWQVTLDSSRTTTVGGFKIGGALGIPYIEGEWAWEVQDHEMEDRLKLIPDDIDILLTHAPPYKVLDEHRGNWGCPKVRAYVERRSYQKPLRAHFFGHVHRAQSTKLGETLFSNAATSWLTFDI